MMKRILALAAVLALALALTACGGAKGSMLAEPNDETGGVNLVMKNAGDGTGVSGDVTIEEGQFLVLSPNLERGSVEVKAFLLEREPTGDDLGIGDEPVLVETVDGKVMSTYDLEPGDYMLTMTSKDNPTGTMMILPYSVEEYQAQNDALAEQLAQLNLDLEETLGQ